MRLHTCPVLAFTPDVEDVFGWFDLTHAVEGGFGWLRWRRIALPSDGGLAQQPAKLMEALAFVADQRNLLIAREFKPRRKGQRTARGKSRRRG